MLLSPHIVDSSNRVMMHITAVHPAAQTQTHHIVHHVEPTHHIITGRPLKVDKATQVDVDLENMSKILSGVRGTETIELIPFIDQGTMTTVPGTTAIVTSNGTLRLLQNGATLVGPNSGYVTLAAAPGTINATHYVTPVAASPPEELEHHEMHQPEPEPEQGTTQVIYAKKSPTNQSRPYSCEECNRTFRFVENLQKHIAQGHSDESKPHKCDTCGKRFPHQWNLNRHIQSHTGERPHVCEICNKRFMRAQHLDQHRKVHEGQRYPCDLCGKQFTHLRNLQRHKRTHGQKMYACDMCEECFMQPEYLAEHKKIHGEYKVYF
jgi:DNA-directed RNA polymerase subunit RPC12/RpoP